MILDEVTWGVIRALVILLIAIPAIVSERRTAHIPNVITLGGLLMMIAISCATWRAFDTFTGLVITAIPFLWLFARQYLHGGGTKLAIALGACVGWPGVFVIVVGALLYFAVGTWSATRAHERRRRLGLPIELMPPVRSSPRLALLASLGLLTSVVVTLHDSTE